MCVMICLRLFVYGRCRPVCSYCRNRYIVLCMLYKCIFFFHSFSEVLSSKIIHVFILSLVNHVQRETWKMYSACTSIVAGLKTANVAQKILNHWHNFHTEHITTTCQKNA